MMLHLVALAILSAVTLAAAKHAECYWTGPGTGTPEEQGFTVFGSAKPHRVFPKSSPLVQSHIEYICEDYWNDPLIADWNRLKERTLELATPCGRRGFSGDCSYGLWAFKLQNFTDPKTGEQDPVRYLRKTDDCEWIGALNATQLPWSIAIYHR